MTWRDFWNADTPIYVGERHKALHYRRIAEDMAALIPAPEATVLDVGCGEALAAERVARACRHLYLCDAAPLVRQRLAARFAGEPRITVLSPEEVEGLADRSLDLIIANSLIQYLTLDELRALLRLWRSKLADDGRLVIADVIPHKVSPVTDAAALLRFAWRGGFLISAIAGLARTAFSEYRRLRRDLGLSHYDEAEMIALLRDHGLSAARRHPNLGHNQARMTFVARPI